MMNRQMIAKELVKIAKSLVATYDKEAELDECLEELEELGNLEETQFQYFADALFYLYDRSGKDHGYRTSEDVMKDARNCNETGDYYDDAHAEEWMEKHPHGYYDSEQDKETGDEDDE